MMRRNFNRAERLYIYQRDGGVCQICQRPLALRDNWHVDHVNPYSRGGITRIRNAQLLCAKCNQSKGNSVNIPEWNTPLRDWQEKAFERISRKFSNAENQFQSFMLSAFPGAGKTYLALRVAHDWLLANEMNRVVVLVPTSKNGLPNQFRGDAKAVGILLTSEFETSKTVKYGISPAAHGIVATYSKLVHAKNREWFKRYCGQYNVLVIADECHHIAGENVESEMLAWGEAFTNSFDQARAALMMTGTAWRSDNHKIPFTEYDNTGELIVDYSFTYREALHQTETSKEPHNRIARQIQFPTMGGWAEFSQQLESRRVEISPDLPKGDLSAALRTIYDVTTNPAWFKNTFLDADAKLKSIRNNTEYPYPDAAGLIIAPSKELAIEFASKIEGWINERPTVVHYEESNSPDLISDFKTDKNKNAPRWIVSVNMISEGVDIPRLTILVYCSYVRQKLYFYQAIGRVIRWDRYGAMNQLAYVYMPFIQPLTDYAQSIKDDVSHVLNLLSKSRETNGDRDMNQPLFVPIDSGHDMGDLVDTRDESITDAEWMRLANEVAGSGESPRVRELVAKALAKVHKAGRININQVVEPTRNERPIHDDPDDRRVDNKEIDTMVRHIRHRYFPDYEFTTAAYRAINGYLNKKIGRGRKQWTDDDYTIVKSELQSWIESGYIPDVIFAIYRKAGGQ